jgi:hypothetical protein
MAGLVPAIHVLLAAMPIKTWMAGINPAMTIGEDYS